MDEKKVLCSLTILNDMIRNKDTDHFLSNYCQWEGLKGLFPFFRDNVRKIRIRLHGFWMSSNDLTTLWKKMSENNDGKWTHVRKNSLSPTTNSLSTGSPTTNSTLPLTDSSLSAAETLLIETVYEPPYDFHVVIGMPSSDYEDEYKAKTIVIQMEPRMKENIDRWGFWSNPKDILRLISHKDYLNCAEWHLSRNYKELMHVPIEKTKTMSCILSSKDQDLLQKKRKKFVTSLMYEMKKKGLQFDCYGDFFSNRLPPYKKDDGLFPYKYHFNCENNKIDNYVTEKLYDAILSETLCFYCGAPNVDSWIDPQAYVVLSLDDFDEDISIIIRSIEEGLYEKRLPFIRAEKKKILNQYQFFPYIAKHIDELL